MSFTDAVRTCINKFATFDGRATRSEFWWFYLFYILVSLVIYVPVIFVGIIAGELIVVGVSILIELLYYWITGNLSGVKFGIMVG